MSFVSDDNADAFKHLRHIVALYANVFVNDTTRLPEYIIKFSQ